MLSCISFDSYIKPQLPALPHQSWQVVYLLIPTSNHNFNNVYTWISLLYIFWFLHQTTTLCGETLRTQCCISFDSYIKPQLLPRKALPFSVVYLLIPTSNHNIQRTNEQGNSVVYLLIPTSNHNLFSSQKRLNLLYIFWFLHQTTTPPRPMWKRTCCISFDSYIKPQRKSPRKNKYIGCISFDSYIKPQRQSYSNK